MNGSLKNNVTSFHQKILIFLKPFAITHPGHSIFFGEEFPIGPSPWERGWGEVKEKV
jgi:hypothetical protein